MRQGLALRRAPRPLGGLLQNSQGRGSAARCAPAPRRRSSAMKPTDADARALALDTSTSFIVQAPAGSGKTELLIQRYLALLAVVDEPERIVAITFTKKAAAEMRERVINALDSASGAEPIAEHERTTRRLAHAALQRDAARKWRLRENASRMRIETFDALCLRIAAQMPWMSRLGAVPSPTEKPYDLYAAAARATVQLVQGSEPPAGALRRLLLHFDNAGALVNQLIGMLEKREQWLPIIGDGRQDMGAVRRRLEQQLAELITENLTLLRELLRGDLASRIARFAGRSAGDLPGASTADVPAWIEIADLLLTKKGDWRKAVTKALPYSLDDSHEELRLELCRVRTLPEPHFDDEQWRILCAVFEVLPMAASQLSNEFAARGESDFTALLFAALEALGPEDDPTDLGLALGSRIEHILVDEFQDTSRSQLRLLKKLTAGWDPTDGRTLFLVGDPMQSIYRFRQAEVGIFLSTRRHGIGSIVPESLKLTQNFRSQPRIVDWVDRVFRGILGHTEDPLSGTVPYARFTAAVAQPGPEPQAHAFFDKAQEEEAARVISLIPEDGTTAILVRARSHLTSIVAALRRAGIRFRAVEIYYLGERPIVQDLMALTFALLHPGDRVSWLAVLRAPWCGLTLADLLATSADKDRPIWSSIGVVTGEGAARIQRIRPAIDRALDERGRRSLRELVEGAWRLLDGPAFAQGQNDLDDAAAYFDLLETLDEGGDLARFDDLRKKVKELFAHPDANADGRIQVMTIHQAKGLEFDTVILPGLGARTREDDPPLLAFHEFGAEGLVVAAKPQVNEDRLYQYITHQENEKAENEEKRQLYVAVTGEKNTLHLLGCAAVKHTNSGIEASASAASFLKLLWNELGPE